MALAVEVDLARRRPAGDHEVGVTDCTTERDLQALHARAGAELDDRAGDRGTRRIHAHERDRQADRDQEPEQEQDLSGQLRAGPGQEGQAGGDEPDGGHDPTEQDGREDPASGPACPIPAAGAEQGHRRRRGDDPEVGGDLDDRVHGQVRDPERVGHARRAAAHPMLHGFHADDCRDRIHREVGRHDRKGQPFRATCQMPRRECEQHECEEQGGHHRGRTVDDLGHGEQVSDDDQGRRPDSDQHQERADPVGRTSERHQVPGHHVHGAADPDWQEDLRGSPIDRARGARRKAQAESGHAGQRQGAS